MRKSLPRLIEKGLGYSITHDTVQERIADKGRSSPSATSLRFILLTSSLWLGIVHSTPWRGNRAAENPRDFSWS
jgi:hypothetical protein